MNKELDYGKSKLAFTCGLVLRFKYTGEALPLLVWGNYLGDLVPCTLGDL